MLSSKMCISSVFLAKIGQDFHKILLGSSYNHSRFLLTIEWSSKNPRSRILAHKRLHVIFFVFSALLAAFALKPKLLLLQSSIHLQITESALVMLSCYGAL